MAHYIFNVVNGDAASARALLRTGMWGVPAEESHGGSLAAGDLVLIYLAAPERVFIGRADLASPVHDWTPAEAQAYPGNSSSGVVLAQFEEWDPPVPMSAVLAQIDPSEKARADFDSGVVRITAGEYETALAVAGLRASTRPRASTSSAE